MLQNISSWNEYKLTITTTLHASIYIKYQTSISLTQSAINALPKRSQLLHTPMFRNLIGRGGKHFKMADTMIWRKKKRKKGERRQPFSQNSSIMQNVWINSEIPQIMTTKSTSRHIFTDATNRIYHIAIMTGN